MHEMNEICKEKHKIFEEKLNEHSAKIAVLEKDSCDYKNEIRNLIEKMDNLISTIKWGLGFFVSITGLFLTILKMWEK